MKLKNISALCIIFILFFSITVSAHSGRTDENGGHIDHSDGTYHYHHGFPSHLHEYGICPYDFEDNTNTRVSKEYHSNNSSSDTFLFFGTIYCCFV